MVGFSGYAQLWANRPVRMLFAAAFFARIPALAAPLVLTLYVVDELDGSYAQAGIVAAATTIGSAIGSPWRGRLIDRLGLRRAIVPSMVMIGILYPVAAYSSYYWLLPLSFFMGLFLIPIFSVVRLALSVMVEPDQHRTAFATDGIMAEASFIIGPAAGAFLVTQFNAATALIAIGLCEVLAGLLFFRLNPPTRSARPADESLTDADESLPRAEESPARWMSVPLFYIFLISAGTMTALIATDLSIIAELREIDRVGAVGLVYLGWGLSSLLGGLLYGALQTSIRPTYLLLTLGLTTIPVGLASNVWTLAIFVIPTGFLCAPTMTAAAEWVAKLVPEEKRGEAMGWQGTAFTIGGAASSPAIGLSIDGLGAWGGFLIGGILATAIAILSLSGQLVPRLNKQPTAP